MESDPIDDRQSHQFGMLIHLSQLLNLVGPPLGSVVPFVMWLVRKEDPVIDTHGKVVANWVLTEFILSLVLGGVSVILFATVVLFPLAIATLLLLIALQVAGTVFAIIGGVRANEQVYWEYPFSFRFFT